MNGYREENSYCYFHPSEAVVGVCPLCLNERLLILASRKGHHHHHSSATTARASYRAQNVMHNKKPSISFPKIFAFSSFLNRLEFLPWKSDYSDHDVSTSQEGTVFLYYFLAENLGGALWTIFHIYLMSFLTNHVFGMFLYTRPYPHDTVNFTVCDDFSHFTTKSVFYLNFCHPKSQTQFNFSTDSFISIKFEENGVASWEKNTVSKVALENCNNMSWNHSFNKETNKESKTVIEHGKPRASSLRWRKRIGHLFQLIRWKRTNKGNVCHVSSKVEGVKVRKGWIRNLTQKRTVE
ncbi:hypothetical protein FEM48_Zijuj06G0128600 [Ziziphus jujuba var. spinosa]|uniref:Uncharacterized protein n=1 Tax=Ziziphus jujuba var. spinosa TaxID=714518 RepID=A0A978V9D9_ZIZJJ|nr:hypothetical protein FEM48_Zijuj06G0128600 [Ziziphus jujuba var. spinosa]